MKKIQLYSGFINQHTDERQLINWFALVDDEDFEWLNQWKWRLDKGSTFYAVRTESINGVQRKIRMHREIMKVIDSSIFVDHIDTYGLNNLKNNLRLCTNAENAKNRKSQKNKTTCQYKGVTFRKFKDSTSCWIAYISINGKTKHIGCFKNKIEAALAHNEAAKKYHGEFARLNVVPLVRYYQKPMLIPAI